MNGIILVALPAAASFIEVKLPVSISPETFDSIMNRIKADFFGSLLPQLRSECADFSVVTYNEEEVKQITSESVGLAAAKTIIAAVGSMSDPNWASKFWTEYGKNNPVIGNAIFTLRNNCDDLTESFLRSNRLEWLISFVKATRFS